MQKGNIGDGGSTGAAGQDVKREPWSVHGLDAGGGGGEGGAASAGQWVQYGVRPADDQECKVCHAGDRLQTMTSGTR